MSISFDRVVTFILPYVSVLAGFLSTWLFTNIHFLGLFNVTQSSLEGIISQIIVFAVTVGAAELGRTGWLKGRHIELAGIANEALLDFEHALKLNSPDTDPTDTSDETPDPPIVTPVVASTPENPAVTPAPVIQNIADISNDPVPTRPESGIVPVPPANQ